MTTAESDEPIGPNRTSADPWTSGTSPDLVRDLVLFTTSLALLASWFIYESLKHPERGLTGLLWSVICALLAISLWSSKPIGGKLASKPRRSFRRRLAALSPLFVLGLIAIEFVIESRQQMAERAMTQRKEVWRHSLELQREAVAQALKQLNDASMKEKKAVQGWSKTTEQVKQSDGRSEYRHDPEAFRKWKEASEERNEAMERHWAEVDRLLHLQSEEPGRFGHP
jgi:hypothetical protein